MCFLWIHICIRKGREKIWNDRYQKETEVHLQRDEDKWDEGPKANGGL